MKIWILASAATLIGSAVSITAETATASLFKSDALTALGLANLNSLVDQIGYPSPNTCTAKNIVVRKEWSRLSRSEKLNYIDAVQCLGRNPAKTPGPIAAGAKTRYDDFVVTHIQLTQITHGNAFFFSWHRYYIWAYEQILRNECGYKGYLPYYNWVWWADNPKRSPLLDGSDTSVSGDGAYVSGRNNTCVPSSNRCFVEVRPANGGGCLTSGPFKNWEVNLGPIQGLDNTVRPNPSPDGLGYNPRCIKRDINSQSSLETRDDMIVDLIENSLNISAFQNGLQNPSPGKLGIHLGGHNTIAGDAGSDFYVSPADPYFWFHHAMVDRTFWTWQNQDIQGRRYQIAGTLTFQNIPPTRNATLDDLMTLGSYIGFPNITLADASSTLAGPFCYIYE